MERGRQGRSEREGGREGGAVARLGGTRRGCDVMAGEYSICCTCRRLPALL